MLSSNDKSGNEEFVKQLTQWTFQEKGVLKMIGYNHHKENETEQLDWYRVKDEIVSKSIVRRALCLYSCLGLYD